LAGGQTEYTIEYRINHWQRGVRRILATVTVERSADGTALRLRGTAHDITEFRTVESDLRASKQRLDLALHGTGVSLWDCNVGAGEFRYDHRVLERMGYGPDEVAYSTMAWDALIHPDDLAAMTTALDSYFKGRTDIFQAIYRIRTKDGDWRWILSRG